MRGYDTEVGIQVSTLAHFHILCNCLLTFFLNLFIGLFFLQERHPAEEEYGYDDYYDEDDGYGHEDEGEGEEYEEEEEDPQPTKEEMEYLELRQRLKEQIRKKNKKANSSALNNTNDRKRKLPYDK